MLTLAFAFFAGMIFILGKVFKTFVKSLIWVICAGLVLFASC